MLLLAAAVGAAAAAHYRPSFDPAAMRPAVAGRPSEVLVLGTPHLSGLPASVTPDYFQLVLNRLAAWHPQIIAIEGLSGPQCEFLLRYKARYGSTFDDYCWDPAPARAATGLDVPAATAEADRLLGEMPAAPTAAQRRRLASVFLAGGEQASALVQWLRLPADERRTGDGLDQTLVDRLQMLETRRNENYLIAAQLAARLGLDRVHAVDDHTADQPPADEAAFGAAMTRVWTNPVAQQRKREDEALQKTLQAPADMLKLYRAYNDPGQAQVAFEGDFGAALKDPSPELYGRRYVGWWETRNLRMVANIRETLAARPGARLLAIVGASHKGYYEAYLRLMHDVRLVDPQQVLR